MAGAVGLMSVALLLFEISMTRLFSVVLNYHFVFLVVSMALLGLGIGGAVCQGVRRSASERMGSLAVLSAGMTGLMLPAVTGLMIYPPWGANWPVYGLLAAVPFVFAGVFFAVIFREFAEASGLLYGADLLGAGAGCLLSIWLLWQMDAITLMLSAGLPPLAGAFTLALATRRRRIALWWAVMTGTLATIIAANLSWGPVDVPLGAPYALQMKTMFAALGDRRNPARILETRWSPLARTDLVQFPDPNLRAIFTDAGAGTLMLRFDGDWEKLAALRRDTGFLPFAVGPRGRVLLIGCGGGKDVLLALMGGAKDVTAVEVNPATVDFVLEHASFTGHLYTHPDVRVVVAEGRSFVQQTHDSYDLVYLSLVFTQAAEAKGSSLVENFIYTVESFQDYLRRLRPGGRLAMVLHDDAALAKGLTTGLVALQREGVAYADLGRHLAVVRQRNRQHEDPKATRDPVLLLRRDPFTQEEAAELARESDRLGLDPLFVPGVIERGLIPQLLLSPNGLAKFEAVAPYNVRPATDDSPFFYSTSSGVPVPLGRLLWGTLGILVVFLVLSLRSGGKPRHLSERTRRVLLPCYFALIGVGFMLAEVALVQKLFLLLGWPTLTLAVALAALLISGGLGSLYTERCDLTTLPRRVQLAMLVVAVLLLSYVALLPTVIRVFLGSPQVVRACVAAALVFMLGIPLGTALPFGLRVANISTPECIPMLWAINGVASVFGSVLALVLALQLGFTAALVTSALAYGAVSLFATRFVAYSPPIPLQRQRPGKMPNRERSDLVEADL